MAGKDLNFDIEVLGIVSDTTEEATTATE